VRGEILVDEHDARVFGEERRVGGRVEVGSGALRRPGGREQRFADHRETLTTPVYARPFEVGEGIGRKAGCEEWPDLERVCAEFEQTGEIGHGPKTDGVVVALVEGLFSAEYAAQASLRRDDSTQFGARSTGSVAYGYAFPSGMGVTSSYGTAFKAPTLNDLYYPGFSNPDLKPESAHKADVAIR